jgi:Domain of unknown function (DUF4382)
LRIRPVSLLATTFAALLGCPLGQTPPADGALNESGDGDGRSTFVNSELHNDAVDLPDSVSWVDVSRIQPGSAALRVLMTSTPVEAESVFVTICSVRVDPLSGDAFGPGGSRDTYVPPEGGDSIPPEGGAYMPPDDRDPAEGGAYMPPEDGTYTPPTEVEPTPTEVEPTPADEEPTPAEEEPVDSDSAQLAGDAPAIAAETELEREPVDGEPVIDDTATDVAEQDPASTGGHVISDQCQTLDLATLQNGVTEALGVATVPAGNYGQIRLVLTEAAIVMSGLRQRLNIPSDAIEIPGGFGVGDRTAITVTLAFDAQGSIQLGEGFSMDPQIHVIDVSANGGTAGEPPTGDNETLEPRPDTSGDYYQEPRPEPDYQEPMPVEEPIRDEPPPPPDGTALPPDGTEPPPDDSGEPTPALPDADAGVGGAGGEGGDTGEGGSAG